MIVGKRNALGRAVGDRGQTVEKCGRELVGVFSADLHDDIGRIRRNELLIGLLGRVRLEDVPSSLFLIFHLQNVDVFSNVV